MFVFSAFLFKKKFLSKYFNGNIKNKNNTYLYQNYSVDLYVYNNSF